MIHRLRHRLLRDPRNYQIASLSAFLLYGLFDLGWTANWTAYATLWMACLGTQAIGIWATKGTWHSLKSAAITALGLSLLLKSNEVSVFALAGVAAIASKYLVRLDRSHLFNPANLGIVVAILCTGEAWISPGQWGSGPMLLFFFGSAAGMVLLRCGRVDTGLWFLGTLALLEVCRSVLFLGWTLDVPLHRLSNGALLLFTFFMITDPKTTPRHPKARALWSITLALAAFVVGQFFYLHTAPVWVLFFAAPLTVLFNYRWRGSRFEWFAAPVSSQTSQHV